MAAPCWLGCVSSHLDVPSRGMPCSQLLQFLQKNITVAAVSVVGIATAAVLLLLALLVCVGKRQSLWVALSAASSQEPTGVCASTGPGRPLAPIQQESGASGPGCVSALAGTVPGHAAFASDAQPGSGFPGLGRPGLWRPPQIRPHRFLHWGPLMAEMGQPLAERSENRDVG